MTSTSAETTIEPLRVAVIVGSIRTDRFSPTPSRWITDQATKRDDLAVDLIDLADHDLPVVLGGNDPHAPQPESVVELGKRVGRVGDPISRLLRRERP